MKRAFRLFAVLLVSASCVSSCSRQGKVDFALRGVNVVSTESKLLIENQTLLIGGGKILSMGPEREIQIPDETKTFELRGKYVIPGLIDAHAHLGFQREPDLMQSELPLYLANGVTTVRNMAGSPRHLQLRKSITDGEVRGPRIITAGEFFYGPPPGWEADPKQADVQCVSEVGCVIKTPAGARQQVERQAALGFDFIKVWSFLDLDVYLAVVSAAKELGIPVAGHVPDAVPLNQVLEGRLQRSIEHLDGYGPAIEDAASPLKGTSNDIIEGMGLRLAFTDPKRLASTIELTVKSGVFNVPTLTVLENGAKMAMGLKFDPSEIKGVEFMGSCWVKQQEELAGFLSEEAAPWVNYAGRNLVSEGVNGLRNLVHSLQAAGAPLVAGSDNNCAYVVPGFSLHRELKLLVEGGLTPHEALIAGTLNAAKLLDVPGGVVKEGLPADLVVLNENPIQDIGAIDSIFGVVAAGEYLSRESLGQELERVRLLVANQSDCTSKTN